MTTKSFKLVRDFLALCVGQVLATVVTFVAFAYLARTLDLESYGFVEFAVALSLFFTMLVDLGLGAIGARELAKDRGEAPRHAAAIPALRLIIAVGVIPVMGLSGYLFADSPQVVHLIWLFAIGILAVPWRHDWLFQGLDMMNAVAAGLVIRTTVFTLGVFVLVRGPRDLFQVGLVEISAAGVAAIFYLGYQAARVTPVRLRFRRSELSHLLRQGSSLGLSNVVWALHQYVQVIFLTTLVSAEETARFGTAHRIVAALLVFSYVYHFNLFPAIVRKAGDSTESLNELIQASFRVVAWAGILSALVISLFARPILLATFGERYAEAGPVLSILIWAFPITALGGHARWSLIAKGQQKCVLFAQSAGAAVSLIAGPILILGYGAVGGACAMVTATVAVWFTAHTFATLRVGHMPFLSSMARPTVLAILLATLILALGSSPWIATTVLAVAVILVPLGDPRLISDLKRLAHAKSELVN